MLVAEIAGDPFQHVVQRRDAEEVAIFVDDEGDDAPALTLKVSSSRSTGMVSGTKAGSISRSSTRIPLSGNQIADQVLLLHDAERPAEIAVARHHDAGIGAVGDFALDQSSCRPTGRSSRRPAAAS